MYCGAPRGDRGDKIDIWPVVKPYVTKDRSKNRGAGVIEMQPVNIDRTFSRELYIKNLIPAITTSGLLRRSTPRFAFNRRTRPLMCSRTAPVLGEANKDE